MSEDSRTQDHAGESHREHLHIPSSLRQQVFKKLDEHHDLKPKDLCKVLEFDYKKHGGTVKEYRKQWKREYKNRQALKCLSFHNVRGWIYALKSVHREFAVERGWLVTKSKNKMYLWKDRLGRLEWYLTGRVNIWVKKPATWGKVKQLLANAFFATGLVQDIQVFDLWANAARFKGAHLVYDTGERLPYARIEYLKGPLSVVVTTGDITHPTAIELAYAYPDWAERNELLLQQNTKALEQFSSFLRDLSEPRKPNRDSSRMVV